MGHRLSKIVTRTGDNGTTGLGDGSRISKDSLRIHVMGEYENNGFDRYWNSGNSVYLWNKPIDTSSHI
jgi:hypothetical protein